MKKIKASLLVIFHSILLLICHQLQAQPLEITKAYPYYNTTNYTVRLDWNAIPTGTTTQYRIAHSTDGGTTYGPWHQTTNLFWEDTNKDKNLQYTYKIAYFDGKLDRWN